MSEKLNPMDKFGFLIGTWNLEYKIAHSRFSPRGAGEGNGKFKFILDKRFVTFDYDTKIFSGNTSAHAVFGWDAKYKIYRYWWFESSGEFMEATCNFINDSTLCLNWHNSILVQTFQFTDDGKIILQMKHPSNEKEYELILEVVFVKKE